VRVAVELADHCIAVFLGPVGQLLDEVLNLFAGGISEHLRAAEVDRIGLDEFGIELVLPDELTEAVSNLRAAVVAVARLR
jgi:GGDEF domain-containing protein